MQGNKNMYAVLGFLFLVFFIVSGLFYYLFKLPTRTVYTSTNTERAVLTKENQYFNAAEALRFQRKYIQALELYKKALPQAKDVKQEAQIKYDIALMTELSGSYTEAIQLYKDIVNNQKYYDIIRASAVQSIAMMRYNYYDAYEQIEKEIFKDIPYSTFYNKNELSTSYRKIFEYGNSIYPLSLSAIRVAGSYARHAHFTLHDATTTPEGAHDISSALYNFDLAQKDLERMRNDPVESMMLPQIYISFGMAAARFDQMGVAHVGDTEDYYKKGIQLAVISNARPGSYNVYHYAAYLAMKYGSKRDDDIKKLLSAFKKGNDENILTTINSFFVTARTNPDLKNEKAQLELLGKLDSDFKTYLVTLGWKQSDFENATNK